MRGTALLVPRFRAMQRADVADLAVSSQCLRVGEWILKRIVRYGYSVLILVG